MERRKSKQFDGTDTDSHEKLSKGASAVSAPTLLAPSSASPGLLRFEVSRAYKEVASAGDAIQEVNVEALGVLLRLMDAQASSVCSA